MTPIEHFAVGSIECLIVPDGTVMYEPTDLAAGVPAAEVATAFTARMNGTGEVAVPYNCLLIRAGGQTALVDTGLGAEVAGQWGEPAGRLMDSLQVSGITADQIDSVVISHAHLDHIGGLTAVVDGVRSPVFARARHYFCDAEWDFWTGDGLAGVPDVLADGARTHLPPLRDAGLVELVTEEAEILPGVRLVPAPGHTPGHLVVTLTSGKSGGLYLGDSILDEAHLAHPDWASAFEWNPGMAVAARRVLLERAIDENRLLIAFHLTARGLAERVGGSYRLRHVDVEPPASG